MLQRSLPDALADLSGYFLCDIDAVSSEVDDGLCGDVC